jgi:hypothetical protein
MGINSATSAITAPGTSSDTSLETSPETVFLKVVGNEKGVGRLENVQRWLRLFFNVFPFPLCKDQLIGDWHENRRGTQIC